ncbi:unnamed protein product [Blepharisma stoltei]|uniref:Uncharacterized protein n=1 Tax=Blepharisma stoltei TaxID=1481888 RepID=A0AAU9IJH4_9CILI|nr:unnamed protein product [Blepharisma stoltei]
MINHKIKDYPINSQPVPRPENFISPYFVEFLEFISCIYLDWNEKYEPRRFLRNTKSISKEAFRKDNDNYDEYGYINWMAFWKGIMYLYRTSLKKALKFLESSEIYFQNTGQLSYLALSEYLLGYLYIIKIKAGKGKPYLKKSKKICKDLGIWSLLDKIYFILGYFSIFECLFDIAEKYLKKGKLISKGSGKHYDIALLKLDILKGNLVSPFAYVEKIKGGFIIFPIQNRLLAWLFAEIGSIYFLLGSFNQAEIYFDKVKITTLKSSDVPNFINIALILMIYYSYNFKQKKVELEELLNIFKKQTAHFLHRFEFYYFLFEVILRAIFKIKFEKNDKKFKELTEKIIVKELKKSEYIYHKIIRILLSLLNINGWDSIAEKIIDYAIYKFAYSAKSPICAYIFNAKSNWERDHGNHESARAYLIKSKKMLGRSMSQKNNQVKMIERQLIEVEEEIAMKNSEK